MSYVLSRPDPGPGGRHKPARTVSAPLLGALLALPWLLSIVVPWWLGFHTARADAHVVATRPAAGMAARPPRSPAVTGCPAATPVQRPIDRATWDPSRSPRC